MSMKMSLKAMRVNKGLSQKESADALHVNKKTISYWESGRTKPSIEMVEPICQLYGCSYDDIDWTRTG